MVGGSPDPGESVAKHFVPPASTTIDGLTLRPWRPGDGALLAETTNASLHHLRPWMEWARDPQTPSEAEVLVHDFAGQYLKREDFILSVWEDDVLIGGTGYHPRWGGVESGVAEIGMWVASSHAGRGYGTRILRALVQWGFSDAWPWTRLMWTCDPANVASARVAEKVGFQLEGTLRGTTGTGTDREATLVYGLLPTDLES